MGPSLPVHFFSLIISSSRKCFWQMLWCDSNLRSFLGIVFLHLASIFLGVKKWMPFFLSVTGFTSNNVAGSAHFPCSYKDTRQYCMEFLYLNNYGQKLLRFIALLPEQLTQFKLFTPDDTISATVSVFGKRSLAGSSTITFF